MPPTPVRNRIYHPGDLIGPYRIERQVAEQGGFGTTYEVWVPEAVTSPFRGLQLALKTYLPSSPQGSLAREAHALRAVRHDNVARYVDEGRTPSGEDYLVAEFVDGSTLAEYLQGDETFEIQDAVVIAVQLLSALASFHSLPGAHDRGVVHRDITLRNVILRESDEMVKLIDFGLAVSDGATMHTQHHTPGFLPPWLDQGGTHPRWDSSVDVFQVGAILYMLLTGRAPYETFAYREPEGLPAPLRVLLRQLCDENAAVPIRTVAEATDTLLRVASLIGTEVVAERTASVASLLDPFSGWAIEPLAAIATTEALVRSIVSAEGLVTRRRVYRLVAASRTLAIPDVAPEVDRALNHLIVNGFVYQDQVLGLADPGSTIRAPNAGDDVARQLGDRAVWDVPDAERKAILKRLQYLGEVDASALALHLGLSARSWEMQLLESWPEQFALSTSC